MKNFLVTGRPGVGKTRVVMEVAERLRSLGYRVGGMVCPELRVGGSRVGFEIVDILTGERGTLAHVDQPVGPQVSKYRVRMEDLNRMSRAAIERALREADLIVIDEIGPMELFSEAFRKAVLAALDGPKPVLAVIHWKARGPFIDSVRSRGDAKIYEVERERRAELVDELTSRLLEVIRGAS